MARTSVERLQEHGLAHEKLHVLQSLHSILRPLPVWLQELGLACMDSDPEARPNFQKVLEMLDRVPC